MARFAQHYYANTKTMSDAAAAAADADAGKRYSQTKIVKPKKERKKN